MTWSRFAVAAALCAAMPNIARAALSDATASTHPRFTHTQVVALVAAPMVAAASDTPLAFSAGAPLLVGEVGAADVDVADLVPPPSPDQVALAGERELISAPSPGAVSLLVLAGLTLAGRRER